MRHKDEIIRLRFQEHLNYREISELLGCSKSTISFHCSKFENNFELKDFSRLKDKSEYDSISNEQKLKIIEYCSLGINITMIASFLKLSERVVRSYIIRNQIKVVKDKKLSKYENVKRTRKRIKKLSVDYLGGSCSRCGYNRCLDALDFHHVIPSEKEFNISRSYKRWKEVLLELNKCQLVCSNCHREIHSTQGDASGLTQVP